MFCCVPGRDKDCTPTSADTSSNGFGKRLPSLLLARTMLNQLSFTSSDRWSARPGVGGNCVGGVFQLDSEYSVRSSCAPCGRCPDAMRQLNSSSWYLRTARLRGVRANKCSLSTYLPSSLCEVVRLSTCEVSKAWSRSLLWPVFTLMPRLSKPVRMCLGMRCRMALVARGWFTAMVRASSLSRLFLSFSFASSADMSPTRSASRARVTDACLSSLSSLAPIFGSLSSVSAFAAALGWLAKRSACVELI
mmetsp:Transcript_46472/g.145410  ORF Transcript_46472/g.145410 Transcript_46472/m.145410 type:complete len:248 (+) Transcript_46472:2989-3732(+)